MRKNNHYDQTSDKVYENPRDGYVADIMRRTRAAYLYAIRRIKRDDQDIVKERFAEAVLNDNNRDFWSETKRMGGKPRCSVMSLMAIVRPNR